MPPNLTYSSQPWRDLRVQDPDANGVVTIFLARAEFHNALTVPMLEDLIQIFSLLDRDDRVKCIIVTGDGRIFCAGVDLKQGFGRMGSTPETHRDAGGQLALAIHHCRKPTIAAINGPAIGVGITMTLPMTIRVACNTAKISFAFARRGISADASSSFYLPRLVGYSKALHLFTTAGTYVAESRLIRDLFSEITDSPAAVMERARAIATEIATNTSQVSTYLTRELIWRGPSDPEAAHLLESAILHRLYNSGDFKEASAAFINKRSPEFHDSMKNIVPKFAPWWSHGRDTEAKPQPKL